MNRLFWTGALALALSVTSASVASAAFYGDFTSPTGTVSFLNVADVNGLYGMPIASGNSLDFSPNSFEAECAASPGCPPTPHTVSDTLTLQVDAHSGNFISSLLMTESGDTSLQTFLGAFAATTVVGDVFLDILEINGVSVNNVNSAGSMVFTRNGQYETNDEGTGTHLWEGLLLLDIDQVIANAGLFGQATLVEVSLSNTLTAYAESGATARIEKKDIGGLAITVIPEPETALLMGLGLLGLGSITRSRE